MKNLIDLRQTLRKVIEDDYKVPTDINIKDLVHEMLYHIGDPDPVLRDELIYSVFARCLVDDQIPRDMLKEILQIAIDDQHLFYKIGEKNTQSVFTRSFSVLIIALILINHRKQRLLEKDQVLHIFSEVTRYFLEEVDIRGYIEENGWAHSVAHAADTLDELAQCDELGYKELHYLLEIIHAKISDGNYVYQHDEDERLVTAMISIINRDLLPMEELCKWIKNYSKIKRVTIQDYQAKTNIKHFLRSLYFRAIDQLDKSEIMETLRDTLHQMSSYK